MFEQFHVDVCKLSRYGKTSYIGEHCFDVGFVLAFLADFADGNEAIGGSLCHSSMAKFSSVELLGANTWRLSIFGEFMAIFLCQVDLEDGLVHDGSKFYCQKLC
ncbi:hypothetical protein O6H91_19G009700 [Diphasiastrum complanatum]|uniref:Uncharacterized protein n=1 Tax=Diphasiastrum complanatum TaxID=34168 RepID=A0ACC2ASR6_DIPCM|nr:hypothetical protein O6H91_19G009700 [Diphasiastrum complanatum]